MQSGDEVTKITGDYSFDGVVVSAFDKIDGKTRYVVEDDRGTLHIYSEKNIRPIGNRVDHEYLKVLRRLLSKGQTINGRSGEVYTLFGEQLRFDISDLSKFPLLTSKHMHTHSIVTELLWFLKGDANIRYLQDHNVTIWDEWADPQGDLGPVYPEQWVAQLGVKVSGDVVITNQIQDVINGLKADPQGRRHIVSAWNPAQTSEMALPPCHCLFQFHVDAENRLSCQLYQRSADWFLGVPFNIASYALLTILIAREVGLETGEFIHTFGNYHLYANHVEQAFEQLKRIPRNLPTLNIREGVGLFDLEPSDITFTNYDPHPRIKAEVSV